MKGCNATGKFFLIIFIATIVAGCHPKQHPIGKAQMKEDVSYFFKCFLATHPNPYCRVTPKQVDSIKTSLLKKIDKGLTKEQFLNELGWLNGLLDGHSYISSPLTDRTEKDTLLFPAYVRVNTDRSLSLIDDRLPSSNAIISINGISGSKIITLLNGMLHADPGVVAIREIELKFPILLSRAGIQAPYIVNVKAGSGDTTLRLNGARQVTYSRMNRAYQLRSEEPELDYSIFQRSKIAILYFNTCNPKNADEFKKKIDGFFATIPWRGIEHLFIDNSRNGGGSSMFGDYLISKINHDAYDCIHTVKKNRITREIYDDIHRQISRVLKSDSANHLSVQTQNTIQRFMKMKIGDYLPDTNYYHKSAVTSGYSGKVYMLVSNKTFSAGSTTAWNFHFSKVGKIIGDKSGSGNPIYTEPAEFTLPYSKVKFGISVRESGYVDIQGKKMALLNEPEPDVPLNINPFKTSYSEQELLDLVRLANGK